MEDLAKITSGKYIPEPGAIYTILRRMEERSLVTSEWEKKETGADRRVYTITQAGVNILKEGLEMVKGRRQLMDYLVQFYESHFIDQKAGDSG
jgi:DNA-binding PadR family transcriptional regulator